MQDIQQ